MTLKVYEVRNFYTTSLATARRFAKRYANRENVSVEINIAHLNKLTVKELWLAGLNCVLFSDLEDGKGMIDYLETIEIIEPKDE